MGGSGMMGSENKQQLQGGVSKDERKKGTER